MENKRKKQGVLCLCGYPLNAIYVNSMGVPTRLESEYYYCWSCKKIMRVTIKEVV